MLAEFVHFVRHAPGVVRLAARKSQGEVLDELLERADAAGVAEHRAELVRGLAGNVLEIGCGTGFMFPHYEDGARVTAIEPFAAFRRRAEERAEQVPASIRVDDGDALELAFEAESFDAVVIGSVLCSVSSVEQAIREAYRVLRPGGELRLMEHVLSERPVAAILMHVCNPLWRLWNRQGCNMNRRVKGPLEAAGFRIEALERFQVFCPGLPAFPSLRLQAFRD